MNMVRTLPILLALVALAIERPDAQDGKSAATQDARRTLQAASTALSADKVKTIQIVAAGGYVGAPGHSYTSRDDWPRYQITSYSRTIDYDAKTSREELATRRAGDYRDYPGRLVLFRD